MRIMTTRKRLFKQRRLAAGDVVDVHPMLGNLMVKAFTDWVHAPPEDLGAPHPPAPAEETAASAPEPAPEPAPKRKGKVASAIETAPVEPPVTEESPAGEVAGAVDQDTVAGSAAPVAEGSREGQSEADTVTGAQAPAAAEPAPAATEEAAPAPATK